MEQCTLQLGEFAVVLFLWTFSRKGAEALRAGSFVWQRRHGAPNLVIQDNREGHRVLLIQRGIFHCHFRWKIDTPTWCPHSRHHAEVFFKVGELAFFLRFFLMAGVCTDRKWQNRCFPGSFDCGDLRQKSHHPFAGAGDVAMFVTVCPRQRPW